MSERDVIGRSSAPSTVTSLTSDLRAIGLGRDGRPVLIHAALSALGWTVGGVRAVVEALAAAARVTEPDGDTLVMPAFSADLSDPSNWDNPPVPEAWWPTVRAEMPAFDPVRTPTRALGRLPEFFRTWPGVRRSGHPAVSFAALGPAAEALFESDPLDFAFRDGPLGALYAADARVLFLGADFETCTAFHLAEIRSGTVREVESGAPVLSGGTRVWTTYKDWDFEPVEDFPACGAAFEASGAVAEGRVAGGNARLFAFRAAVDFAETWFRNNRPPA